MRRGRRCLRARATPSLTCPMIAAAASLLMGQADEGTPVVLLRGLQLPEGDGSAADLHRARELDLFR